MPLCECNDSCPYWAHGKSLVFADSAHFSKAASKEDVSDSEKDVM